MNTDYKIEQYLSQLDRALWALPVGQRSEIITEIKSHLRDAVERDPQKPIDSILSDMGSAQDVANRYLTDRGVQMRPTAGTNSSAGPWLKWLMIGFASFIGLVVFSTAFMLWYFSPLIKVDGEHGRVSLLGGAIDIHEDLDEVRIGDMNLKDMTDSRHHSEGKSEVTSDVKSISIPFNSAKIEISNNSQKFLTWECKSGLNNSPKTTVDAGVMTLNLDILQFAKCSLKVPKGISLSVKGVNGKLDMTELQNPLDVNLVNGKVGIAPLANQAYDFDVNVKNGKVDQFERSTQPGALKVKVSVINGLISKD